VVDAQRVEQVTQMSNIDNQKFLHV